MRLASRREHVGLAWRQQASRAGVGAQRASAVMENPDERRAAVKRHVVVHVEARRRVRLADLAGALVAPYSRYFRAWSSGRATSRPAFVCTATLVCLPV